MDSKEGVALFKKACEVEAELHAKKNADYTGDRGYLDNFMRCETLGVPAYFGVLVRLMDKYSRQETLALKEPKVVGEPMEDVHKDISVYSKIAQVLYDDMQECPGLDTIIKNLEENSKTLQAWRKDKIKEPYWSPKMYETIGKR